MAHKKQIKQKSNKKRIRVFFIIAAMASLVAFNFWNKKSNNTVVKYPAGPANYCKAAPQFIEKYGIRAPWAIDLTQSKFTGLRIIEYRENGKTLQLPTWDDAGNLVSYAVDKKGNIYLTPAPYVSLFKNPPLEQNNVYIVDSKTGVMSAFINLPNAATITSENPFGSIGLAYDCDHECLYVSTLAGSTYENEVGTIYQIDLKTKQIVDEISGIDALGLTLFNSPDGKRLYYGAARESAIYAIALDQDGNFDGQPEYAFSLLNQKGGGLDKGVRLQIKSDNSMQIKAMEFSYSLMASSDPLRNVYTFDFSHNTWRFREMHKQ
jgi:hypothetical protein